MENNRVCLTTFIYGEKYQDYIPLLVYSCHKSYPDYDIFLFLHEKLNIKIKQQLDLIPKSNICIKEECFLDCPSMDSLKAKALRWVLWDTKFSEYDYIYTMDVDMIYIREPIPLHVQHVTHMAKTGLCFDNLRRIYKRTPFNYISFLQRIKHAGTTSLLSYLFSNKIEYKLTGLHFVDVKKYYIVLDDKQREKYRNEIYYGSWLRYGMTPNNEIFLYHLQKELGNMPDRLSIQTDSLVSLDFNNPTRDEFRPHHGIHMGIFRTPIDKLGVSDRKILNSDTYKYYWDIFINDYCQDSLFHLIIEGSSFRIKDYYSKMVEYYQKHILKL